jgi:transcriptional regulator with XRE-family HTH domain
MFKVKASDGTNNLCGQNVRKIRKSKKLSQEELGHMLQLAGYDMDSFAILRIENGKRFVTDIEMKALCDVLDISIFELLPELKVHEKKTN